jgi:hypothetical protein
VLLAFHIDDDFSAQMRGEVESILTIRSRRQIVLSSSGKRTALAATTDLELVVHVKAIWSADNRTNIIFASPLGPVYQPSRFRQLVSPGSGVMTAALIDVGSACRWRLS